MATRMKEQGYPNHFRMRHDGIGNYSDQNGVRAYSLTTALTHGLSTTAGGSTAPRGSIARTSHATGRDSLFVAGATTWQEMAVGGASGVSGAKTYKGIFDQAGVAAPTLQTAVVNQLGGALTLGRTGVGVYTLSLLGAFPVDKLFIEGVNVAGGATGFSAKLERTDDNTLTLRVFNAAGAAADLVGDVHVHFTILP
jgi:hypothetical protein